MTLIILFILFFGFVDYDEIVKEHIEENPEKELTVEDLPLWGTILASFIFDLVVIGGFYLLVCAVEILLR